MNPPFLEFFSSGGTTPVLFNAAGMRLGTADPRANKPQIVATDGGDTTFFGTDNDGSGFPNFFGTSAAAPHAAAVGALIIQAIPPMTPPQVLATLQSTAIDMGPPGFDNDSGFGLIQAYAALLSLARVTGITPDSIDLASPPGDVHDCRRDVRGSRFRSAGGELRARGIVLAQARATELIGSTTLTVPFPTNGTSLAGPLPGLSTGTVDVQVFLQTGFGSYGLLGSVTLTVTDTRGPTAIAPNPVDLATPPASFTITGIGFADLGFGLLWANFTRGGVLLTQARAIAPSSGTSLTVPFPNGTTASVPGMPGLSAGTVDVQVFLQTGPSSYSLLGSVTLTITDTRGPQIIVPNPVDLASAPTTFTITGTGFANLGFGLPWANFTRGGVLLTQARAIAPSSGTSLTVPFPNGTTTSVPGLPGL